MALRPLIKQTIAKDQNEVASKLDELIVQNSIERDTIIDIEIQKFGANQFLILAVYYGSYLLWTLSGLVAAVARLLKIQRVGGLLSEGLALSVQRKFDSQRSLSPSFGLVSTREREVTFSRILSVALGVLAERKPEVWLAEAAELVGLAPSVDATCEWEREFATSSGLVSVVGYSHTKHS